MRNIMIAFALIAGLGAGCKKDESSKGGGSEPKKETMVPECEAYHAAMDKFVACDKLLPEEKEGYGKSDKTFRESHAAAKTEEQKKAVAEECTGQLEELKKGAEYRGCPLE